MQQTERTTALDGAGRKRVEAVMETLTSLGGEGNDLAEVAHDARNMVTALAIYCDLLEEPGVLATSYVHYGNELRLVASASRRLVEKLVALDTKHNPPAARLRPGQESAESRQLLGHLEEPRRHVRHWEPMPAVPVDSLAAELLANRNLLAALAGPAIALTVDTEGGALPVGMTGEDLTRILVNLVKNAAEAMPGGGRIQVSLRQKNAEAGVPRWLLLAVEDCGPGIPERDLERIFETGYSTQPIENRADGWAAAHRGLGLSITRSIVEAVGGRICAANRTPTGARLTIELPVRTR